MTSQLMISVAMTVVSVVLCITVSWLFVGLAAGAAVVGVEHVWRSGSRAPRAHRRADRDR